VPDTPGNQTTTASITVGGTYSDTLETLGDHDWIRLNLTAGQSVTIFVDGITLDDSYLRVRNSAGTLLYENDDIVLGVNRDSQLSFTATTTGTYYIDVGSYNDSYTGTYQVSVTTYTPPPLASYDTIADQLVNGYWGGDFHHFDVTQGGSITVNITGLTAAGQTLARAALQEWTDIIGVNFVEVTTGGQIVFDDNQSGAATDGTWSNHIITSEHVNVSTQWLATYGTGLNSYSFQTYVHEIGHALGLGHAGNYNGTASYPYDASFSNDAWVTSIMSYFSPTENTYFAGQGFTENFVITPAIADIIAMSELYGLSTTTRTGNTTYGFNSNAGSNVYNAVANPGVAYCIFDSGGTDTLDYSGFSTNQVINLNPETFSSVGPGVGNVSIARGVTIENAIGGTGNDTIIGNAANNVLTGGAGIDAVSYETAGAGVTVSLGNAAQQNTGGAGLDTLSGFENLIGSTFNDTLTGNSAANVLAGGLGNDQIEGGAGNDSVDGGSGYDFATYRTATAGVTVSLADPGAQNTGGGGTDTLVSIEGLIGSAFADTLSGGSGVDTIYGLDGDDTLNGSAGSDTLDGMNGNDTLNGGTGADYLIGGAGNDTFLFATGDGQDVVHDLGSGDIVRITGYTSAQSVTQVGSDVLLTLSSSDQITFKNSTVSAVQAAVQWSSGMTAMAVAAAGMAVLDLSDAKAIGADTSAVVSPGLDGVIHNAALVPQALVPQMLVPQALDDAHELAGVSLKALTSAPPIVNPLATDALHVVPHTSVLAPADLLAGTDMPAHAATFGSMGLTAPAVAIPAAANLTAEAATAPDSAIGQVLAEALGTGSVTIPEIHGMLAVIDGPDSMPGHLPAMADAGSGVHFPGAPLAVGFSAEALALHVDAPPHA